MDNQTTRWHKPDLDAFIKQRDAEIKLHIPITAAAFAAKQEPSLSNENLATYYLEHHLAYQELLHHVHESLQTNNMVANGIKHDEQTEADIAELQNDLNAAREEQLVKGKSAEHERPPYAPRKLQLAWAAVAILSLFEGIVNRPSFTAWGYNLIEACCMSLAFAVLLAIMAHSFDRIMALGKTVWQRRCIAVGQFTMLCCIFWYLSTVRAEHLSVSVADDTGEPTTHFSALPFALLSILLFIAALAVCHFIMPTRDQREAMREYQRLQTEKQAKESRIQQIRHAIKLKVQENCLLNETHDSLQEYGADLEQRIISLAHHGLEVWKRHNLLHRRDGRPKSFDDPIYPLQFKTRFHHVNLL